MNAFLNRLHINAWFRHQMRSSCLSNELWFAFIDLTLSNQSESFAWACKTLLPIRFMHTLYAVHSSAWCIITHQAISIERPGKCYANLRSICLLSRFYYADHVVQVLRFAVQLYQIYRNFALRRAAICTSIIVSRLCSLSNWMHSSMFGWERLFIIAKWGKSTFKSAEIQCILIIKKIRALTFRTVTVVKCTLDYMHK